MRSSVRRRAMASGSRRGSNRTQVVTHPDESATIASDWQPWAIPLDELRSGGVDVTSVKRLYIGAGDRANPQPGGAGLLYIDDIGFGHPAQSSGGSTVRLGDGPGCGMTLQGGPESTRRRSRLLEHRTGSRASAGGFGAVAVARSALHVDASRREVRIGPDRLVELKAVI